MSNSILPFGQFLDNDSPHNFSKLAHEFLEAAKFTHAGFNGTPTWPTYFLAFQSLENFLKAYLLANGATMDHVKNRIGHRLCDALAEAKKMGLAVHAPSGVEDAMMTMSRNYTARDFQYRGVGGAKSGTSENALTDSPIRTPRASRIAEFVSRNVVGRSLVLLSRAILFVYIRTAGRFRHLLLPGWGV